MARVVTTARATSDTTLALTTPLAAKQALSKLTKPSLCVLALTWLSDAHLHPARQRKRPRLDVDSDASSEEEEELEQDLRGEYGAMRDDAGTARARVVQSILKHWVGSLFWRRNRGAVTEALAVNRIEVSRIAKSRRSTSSVRPHLVDSGLFTSLSWTPTDLKDKPTARSWTAYQLKHSDLLPLACRNSKADAGRAALASPSYTTPAQLSTRLRAALTPYHKHVGL